MDTPKLIISRTGKPQLHDRGFTLCLNKTKKDRFYFVCTHQKPLACKVRAVVKGELIEQNFEVVSHDFEKHQHDKIPEDVFVKNFHEQFKRDFREKIDKPVQQIYEELKIRFTSSLTPFEKTSFLAKLPPPKGSLMIGYRARSDDHIQTPKFVSDIVFPDRFASTHDGEPLDRGKTQDNCHLLMSRTMCQLAGQGGKWWIDATYLTTPKPAYQTLVTRTKLGDKTYTTSFTLMPDKKKSTYISALNQIKETCAREGVMLRMT